MLSDKLSLADEIQRLEKDLDSQHFRALFDRKAENKKRKHLKKLRKELAELEGTAVPSQPVRRAEPKPAPKPKTPKAKPVMARVNAIEPKPPVKPARATVAKPSVARKPAARPASGRKPATKTTRSASKKPAAPVSKARKKSS